MKGGYQVVAQFNDEGVKEEVNRLEKKVGSPLYKGSFRDVEDIDGWEIRYEVQDKEKANQVVNALSELSGWWRILYFNK